MITAFITGKKTQDACVIACARAAKAEIIPIGRYLKNGLHPKTQGVIFSGILRGNALLMKECLARGISYYYIDHAYFNAGYKSPNWMRFTKNGFVQNRIITANSTRWNQYFSCDIQPYKYKNQKDILVLPPSNAMRQTFDLDSWLPKTIEKLKKHTNRNIIVRHKDGPVLKEDLINPDKWIKYNYPPLDELWKKVYCVVAYNSNATIEALTRGIPVITTKHNAAWPVSNRIENIEHLIEHNRQMLFDSLAWGQFNYKEIKSGFAFKYVNTKNQYRD